MLCSFNAYIPSIIKLLIDMVEFLANSLFPVMSSRWLSMRLADWEPVAHDCDLLNTQGVRAHLPYKQSICINSCYEPRSRNSSEFLAEPRQ